MKLLLSITSQEDKNNNSYHKFFTGLYRTNLNIPKYRVVLKDVWPSDPWVRVLKDSIDEWLKSYNIDYSLDVELIDSEYNIHKIYYWYIDIPEEYILLFKLTWM
jgi:hypothetical protein